MKHQLPTFMDKLKTQIESVKDETHRYILVGSGTIQKLNKDFLKDVPYDQKAEKQRALIYDWQMGKNTLCGLSAIVKDQTLLYESGDVESICNQIKREMTFDIKNIIVPDHTCLEVSHFAKSVKIIPLEECLFIN